MNLGKYLKILTEALGYQAKPTGISPVSAELVFISAVLFPTLATSLHDGPKGLRTRKPKSCSAESAGTSLRWCFRMQIISEKHFQAVNM